MNVQVSQYFCPLVLCLLRWCCVFCCVVIGVMERSVLWGSSPHRCLLAFTSALLLCEIVIGRLCNSLINMVDSFHTLYILIHLTLLPLEKLTGYSLWRAQPFGAVLSALLLISLCISISLQVISSTLQALTIKRPLLATVIGAASLMFNSAILIWRGGRKMDVGVGARLSKDLIETQNENVAISNDTVSMTSHLRAEHSFVNILLIYSLFFSGRSELVNCRPKRQQRRTCVKGTITVIRGLLSSVLVLANGLIFLLAGAGCLQPRSDCRYLRYLDPAFSVVTVLVLIGTTLPEFCRHALVLLQATPSHLRMEELTASIGQVPGVLAVHELHVWQLSGMHLVGSVHVHCPSGLRAVELVPDTVDAAVQAHCSLQCGKECAKKMCCSPAQVRPCSRALSTADMLVKQQDIVLENPYL
uniref:Cation efflux protein cytoplasmic domain-containing protein n=1 Tax=Astyanax mexicanus TaxID=7994 RepID=A0A8B9JGS1_ASTMX